MHSFACICYMKIRELIDGNNTDFFIRLAVVSNCPRADKLREASASNFAESAFLARYSTSKAALKVMSIGGMPADGFASADIPR